jgi:hypothetical protein
LQGNARFKKTGVIELRSRIIATWKFWRPMAISAYAAFPGFAGSHQANPRSCKRLGFYKLIEGLKKWKKNWL